MSSIKKAVFLCDTDHMNSVFDSDTQSELRTRFEIEDIIFTSEQVTSNEKNFQDIEYIFTTWGAPKFSAQEIKKFLPNLKAVFYAAGSVKEFAEPFLDCGVKIFSAWAANAIPVAEHSLALILLSTKGYNRVIDTFYSQKHDESRRYLSEYPGNYNTKIGLLGAGMIGRHLLKLLRAFDLEVLVYDPFASKELISSYGAKLTDLKSIFSECHIVSNHMANVPQTIKILNYELFSLMQQNSVFINTGRGAQVDEDGLIRALKENPSQTAILDVTDPEPPSDDSELWTLPNAYLTPHIAGSMGNEVARMGRYMQMEAFCLLDGRECRFEVTKDMLSTMA